MRIAFTMDDLPIFPHLELPDGYSPASVANGVMKGLERNNIDGVYAFANSWPLDVDPDTAGIFDAWVSAGHLVGNHTHSHPLLNDVSGDAFISDISIANGLLKPWMDRAPQKLFRHPLNLWGDTEDKRSAVNGYIEELGYTPADVTSFFFEWEWDQAWRWLLQTGRTEEAEALKSDFIDFCIAQLAHNHKSCQEVFGRDVVGIALGHFVAFLSEVIDPLMARVRREGIEIVPLEEALADSAYDRVGSVVTDKFQVYQQKMAASAGRRIATITPACDDLMKQVFKLAEPLRPARRGQLVQNKRGPNP